jgi:hypothetical protein
MFRDDQTVTGVVGGERVGQCELLVIAGKVSVTDAFKVKPRVMRGEENQLDAT